MTTPEMKIVTSNDYLHGWKSKTEGSVESFAEKIGEAPSGAIITLHYETQIAGNHVEKTKFINVDHIETIEKTHSEYAEEIEE